MRALLPVLFVLLAACGDEKKEPVPQPGTAPPDQGSKAEQIDRLKAQGTLAELRRKMEEINRPPKPLTDADVDHYVAVWPDWDAAATADPAAKRAVLEKHKTNLITFSQLATRIAAAYTQIKSGKNVPGVHPGDVDVVRKRLGDIERLRGAATGGDALRKGLEMQERANRSLTDADLDLWLKVYPEWATANVQPTERPAMLAKHGTDLTNWSFVSVRVNAAYGLIQSGTEVPPAFRTDVEVVKKRLAEVKAAMESRPK